jgi:hypothetical protein
MGATLKVLFPYFITSLQIGARAASDITLKELIASDFEQNPALLRRYAPMFHEIYHSLSIIT